MKKRVFYLKNEKVFIQNFENPNEIITWIYRWNGEIIYSTAMKELTEIFYNDN
jgi:hypothetical protein